ncbi:hypothetical protein VFPPC_13676 [Pochonia chlamydosporia 170]|uniref:Uncharacterized protein n=1 Tax=Pochonia chlamydosporia 170 TaxID=1380566 RepID=A0A179FS28_METCM|nr:hypothetical protein VFPPC_13676 [Pochonia chlamydosporia 170]OAQ68412.1 hypothetical protein VFPPC_13676 [Pochonia chlamydosporia 170]
MSNNIFPVVHTQLWKDRQAPAKYTAPRPSTNEPTSTRVSCGCRTSNADLAAWCALHSEEIHTESHEQDLSSPTDVEASRAEGPRSRPSQDALLEGGQSAFCPLEKAFDCVGVTDTEREYLYRRLFEGMEEQRRDRKPRELPDEVPVFTGTEEEKDRQFRDWVWHEFNGWVEFMYPDGSRGE